MSAASHLSRTRQGAARLALATSSIAPVTYGYERSLRPRDGSLSRLARTIQVGGGG